MSRTPWMQYLTLGVIQGTLMFLFLIWFYFGSVVPQYNRSFEQDVDEMILKLSVLTDAAMRQTPSPANTKIIERIRARDLRLDEKVRQVEENNERIQRVVQRTGVVVAVLAFLFLGWVYWCRGDVFITSALITALISMVFVAAIEFFFLFSVNNRYRVFSHHQVSNQLTKLLSTKE